MSAAPGAAGETGRGDWLGRYRVITRLGRGGMATVYLAASLGPDDFSKLVVIKELLPELNEDPDFARMFRTEGRLAARLQHPNVVQTYDAWHLGPQQFLTMEFLDGQPLHRVVTRLGRGALGLPEHLYVMRAVLAALHYAHELCDYDGTPLGLVHRDVSPHNVFLTYDGQVKLVDFGIAKAAGAATTEAGTFKGKTNYAAPEQIRGGEVDRRADVFAAGVMLWEALTGRPIWEPGREQANALFERLEGRDAPVLEVNPQADPDLAAICARAMAPDPDERFATAHEFREALEEHPLGAPATSAAVGLGARLSTAFAAEREAVQGHIEAVLQPETRPPAEPPRAPAASPDAESSSGGGRPPSWPAAAGPSSRPTAVRASSWPAAAGPAAAGPSSWPAAAGLPARPEAAGSPSWPAAAESPARRGTPLARRAFAAFAAFAAFGAAGTLAWRAFGPAATAGDAEVATARAGGADVATARAGGADVATAQAGGSDVATARAGGAAAAAVTVTIRATPERAVIFVDGEPIRGNPVRFSAPPDGRAHRFRAEAEGFVAEERLAALEPDAELTLRLVPAPEAEGSAREVGRQGPRPARPKGAPPAAGKRRGAGRDIDDDPYGP